MESWLLAQQAQLLSIRCSLEGMIAENGIRRHRGESPAYSEKEFDSLRAEAERISNYILQNR